MAVYPTKSCDRVWETDTVTGTGTISLGSTAATGGYRTFDAAYTAGQLASGDLVRYGIRDTTTYAWEMGLGTYTNGAPSTLSRTIVFQSSNSNALVSFAGNPCDIWIDANASKIDQGLLPFVAGNWYGARGPSIANASITNGGNNTIAATPLEWRGPATPVALGCYCSTAPSAATTFYLGIYDGSPGYPTTLLASVSMSITATGWQVGTLSSPPTIDVPNVFLAIGIPSTTNSVAFWCLEKGPATSGGPVLGVDQVGVMDTAFNVNFVAGFPGYNPTYGGGALPSSFPAIAQGGGAYLPQVLVEF